MPGNQRDAQNDREPNSEPTVPRDEQVYDPWNKDDRNAKQRQQIEQSGQESDQQRIAHAKKQQRDENDAECNRDQLQLCFQIGSDPFNNIFLQKCIRMSKCFGRMGARGSSPRIDLDAEEVCQYNRDAEIDGERREGGNIIDNPA